jgi:hypothetical protein
MRSLSFATTFRAVTFSRSVNKMMSQVFSSHFSRRVILTTFALLLVFLAEHIAVISKLRQ